MPVLGLDHFTLRCDPDELEGLRSFYVEVLGLAEGGRADFDFPGHWLYAGGRAIVHLAGTGATADPQTPAPTGRLDHISLRTSDLHAYRERLSRHGIVYRELPVPGLPLHQLFLCDPTGLKIELTFGSEEAG